MLVSKYKRKKTSQPEKEKSLFFGFPLKFIWNRFQILRNNFRGIDQFQYTNSLDFANLEILCKSTVVTQTPWLLQK